MAKFSKARTPVTNSAEAAIESAWSAIEDLHSEISEGIENQREHAGIAATSRFATMEETSDTLESIKDDQPEWPEPLDESISAVMIASYIQNYKKGLSRADRRDNIVNELDGAIDAIRAWIDEQTTGEGSLTEEMQEKVDAATELADALEEKKDELDGLEFPGMRG